MKSILNYIFAMIVFAVLIFAKFSCTTGDELHTTELEVNNFDETNYEVTTDSIKSLFDYHNLGNYWETFKPKLRSEIRIYTEPKAEKEIKLGQSKIGGLPDLPKNVDWFKQDNGKALAFIAQINCKDLKNLDQHIQLPDTGIIYFFYSARQESWGYDINDKDKFKVYYAAKTDNLEKKKVPDNLEAYYRSCNLKFKNAACYPGWGNDVVRKNMTQQDRDSYFDFPVNENINKMFGYADDIQDEMELECQLVTNGLYCGDATGYNDPRRPELEKGMKDWQLLLQIDSEEDKTGMMWGDAGRLYFWIKKQDLKNLDFDKSWLILQCY